MVEVRTYKQSGDVLEGIEVDETAFCDKVKKRLLKEAVLMYEANLRQGTHSTLTRAEVSLTGRKPFRQKGTGYARAGDYKSPLWRGGGVVFGPKPRDYSYSMPRKAKREALRTALYAKLVDGEVSLLDDFTVERPSTKSAAAALAKFGFEGSVLVVLPPAGTGEEAGDYDVVLFKSFRNIPFVRVVPSKEINAFHLLRNRNVVFVGNAFESLKERLIHE